MLREVEATRILRQHHIPFKESGSEGILALLCKSEVDPEHLRQLGFRISRDIGAQWVVFYKGGRIGLIV